MSGQRSGRHHFKYLNRQALCEALVLQIPNFAKPFILVPDASDIAISAAFRKCIN